MAEIDFIEDEEASGIDFTPDPASAVALAPRPIVPPPQAWEVPAYMRRPVAAPQFWQSEYRGGPSAGETARATAMSPYGAHVTPQGQIETRIPFDPSKGLAPLSKLALTPEEVEAGMEMLASPFLSEKDRKSLRESPLTPSPLAKATAGFTQGAYRTAESLTSPMNLGLLVGTAGLAEIPAAARLLSGAFTADMARHVPEQARQLGEAVASKDPEAIARSATELAATGAFTTMAGTHAVGPRPAVMLPETLRELAKEPSTPRPNAIQEQPATETVRGLPEQPAVNEPLPAEKGVGEVPRGTIPPGDTQGAPRAAEARAAEVSLTEAPGVLLDKSKWTKATDVENLKAATPEQRIAAAQKPLDVDSFLKEDAEGYRAVDPEKLRAAVEGGHITSASPASDALLLHLLKESDLHPLKSIRMLDFTPGEAQLLSGTSAPFHGRFSKKAGERSALVEMVMKQQNGKPVTQAEFMETLTHELGHNTITSKFKDAPPEIAKDVDSLFKFVQERGKGTEFEKHNALTSAEELFAELADPRVHKWLSELDYTADIRKADIGIAKVPAITPPSIRNSALGRFLEIAKKLLKLPDFITDAFGNKVETITALDQMVSLSSRLERVQRSGKEAGTNLSEAKAGDFNSAIKETEKVSNEELAAYKGTAGAGATGFMWDLGAKAKTAEDVAALKKMGEDASAETKALMAAGDMMGAMRVIGRQPAEAYEYATGVKLDGTPKWETFEKMAAKKGQTYRPSVPDPQYVKAKGEAIPTPAPPAPAPRGIAASVRGPGGLRGQSEAGAVSLAPVQAAVDAFKTKALQQLPKLKDVSKESLPDLGKREDNKKIATEPTGFGRTPVLGWLLDPRQKANLPHEKAILTWFYEKAMGDAHVQALSSTFGTRFKKLFPRNETGELNNVGTTQAGQSRHPSDVFEGLQRDPNSYVLTPEQRAGFNELMKYEEKLRGLAKKYKIRLDEETGDFVDGSEGQTPYWTRGRTIKRGAETRSVGGTMIGARQYFQKGRTFKTEAEGVAKGFEYPLNVEDRLIMRAERLYKAIADRRLSQDKDLGGRWGGTPTYEESQVFQPAFRREFTMQTPEGTQHVSQSKIFPVKTANALNKAFGNQSSTIRKSVASANNFLKSMTLGFDFGVGQIQLLGTAYKNPGLWGKANWTAMKAFLSRDVFAKYAEQNAEPIRELAQYGSGVGRLPEMMAGLESGELMTAGPRALGKAIERAGAKRTGKAVAATAEVPAAFARQFQTFMDVAKVELWKARREVVPRDEWAREVQAIESQLLSSNMERIGVTPNRALVERMLLLAPSYYRGALNQIGGLAAKGASGETYRRAMGAYMLGTTATFVGMALAAGLSWDDIRKRLNPARGDFMMVPVKTGKRTIEVGFGGIMRSFMRLGGEIAETSVEHPGNWKSLAPDKNPITRWLRGHAAPVPAKAWDAFSGKDYMGEESDMASLGKGTLPLAAQQLFGEKTPRTPGGVALETATQFFGASSFPGKTTKQRVGSMYRDWQEKQTDPKIKANYERNKALVLPVGKYKALDDALSIGDESAAISAIAAVKAEGQKNKDILDRMRPYTGNGIESRTKPLFHGEPPQFKASLKPAEREEYQKAIAERKAMYQEFLKAWRKRGTAPKTGPAIDFVPDTGQ